MPRVFFAVLLFVCSACTGSRDPLSAKEYLEHCATEIRVQPDRTLLVTDVVVFVTAGGELGYGIERGLPVRRPGPGGRSEQLAYDVMFASLDGGQIDVPPLAERHGFRMLRLGDPERKLIAGRHRLEFQYRVRHAVERVSGFDELSWEVTGYFPLPVRAVRGEVILPRDVDPRSVTAAAIVHRFGETPGPAAARARTKIVQHPESAHTFVVGFEHAPIEPLHGLVVTVRWPAGFIR